MLSVLAFVVSALASSALAGNVIQDLSSGAGSKWVFASANGSVTGTATVPGTIHTDLLANGIISEPYSGSDPVGLMRWVGEDNWTYTGHFVVDSALLANDHVVMVAEGVDTVADVSINGAMVAHLSNMFHRSRIPVKGLLLDGDNTISIAFTSKPAEANAGLAACNSQEPKYCPQKVPNQVQHGFDNFNYVRTEQCSASWDWGPGFAPVGVWRDLYLFSFNDAVIRDLIVIPDAPALRLGLNPSLSPGSSVADKLAGLGRTTSQSQRAAAEWSVKASVIVDAGAVDVFNQSIWAEAPETTARVTPGLDGEEVHGTLTCSVAGITGATVTVPVIVPIGGSTMVECNITGIRNVSLWMPSGYGQQPLYLLTASFASSGAESALPRAVDSTAQPAPVPVIPPPDGSLSRRFGFRVVELVQDYLPGPDPPQSKSYYTRINGVPVVWHGSNFVPTDAFQSRVNRQTLAKFVAGLRGAGQNAIRIWGGGVYPKQALYDLLDEQGILIWHDAMLSDAQYPVQPLFLQSIAKEVRDATLRIGSSPSVAVYAGNNEDEGGYKPGESTTVYYSQLTFGTVLSNISAIDTSRPLSGSSPSCGNETASYPVCPNVRDVFSGDVHMYLYTEDYLDVTIYPRPRAMTEFGLQSWPEFATMKNVVPETDWYYLSPTMIRRNHHPGGVSEMSDLIARHWRLPQNMISNTSDAAGYRSTLYLSQIYQAYAYYTEINHLRRIRTECDNVNGGCAQGGMLYWQAQNIWPGASWASIDSTARYQASLYLVKHAYAPILPSAFLLNTGKGLFDDSATFGVYVVNDSPDTAITGALRITCASWSTGVTGSFLANYSTGPANSTKAVSTTLGAVRSQAGCGKANGTVVTLEALASSSPSSTVIGTSTILTDDFISSPGLRDPKLQIAGVVDAGKPAPPAEFGSSPSGIQLWEEVVVGHAFTVTVAFEQSAAFVWLSTDVDGFWEDNAVHLFTSGGKPSTRDFTFYARDATATAATVQNSLEVMSVWDTADYSD